METPQSEMYVMVAVELSFCKFSNVTHSFRLLHSTVVHSTDLSNDSDIDSKYLNGKLPTGQQLKGKLPNCELMTGEIY
jgi:hypothetical protein